MLKFFRKASEGYIFKFIFLLIILSFAGWGLSGIFAGNLNSQAVAKVGNQSITQQALYTSFQRNFSQLKERMDQNLTAEQAIYNGLLNQSLDQLVMNALLTQASKKAHLHINDNLAIQRIKEMNAFNDLRGRFDPQIFNQILMRNNLSEDEFIQSIKNDISIQLLMSSLLNGIKPSQNHLELAHWIEHEQRSADIVQIDLSMIPTPKDPGDDVLETFMHSKSNAYRSPELRNITYLKIDRQKLKNNIDINDAQLKEIYNDNIDRYSIPEKRDISQIIFETKDQANAFYEKARKTKNKDIDALSKTENVKIEKIKQLSRSEIVFKELSDWVFSSKSEDISPPIETSIGWLIAKLNHVSPPHIKIYEMVKEQLKEEYINDELQTKIDDLAMSIEEKISEGQNLQDIAQSNVLSLYTVKNLDAQGNKINAGKNEKANLPIAILQESFTLEQDEDGQIIADENDNLYIVKVDDITPSQQLALSDNRPTVLKDWQYEEKTLLLKEKAIALLEKANTENLENIAKQEKAKFIHFPYKKRENIKDKNRLISNEAYVKIFENDKGKPFTVFKSGQSAYIIKVTDIKINKDTKKENLQKYNIAMKNQLQADVMHIYRQNLSKEIEIETNEKSIEALVKHFLNRK